MATPGDTDLFDYDGSTFEYVKSVTFSGPYEKLPQHQGLGIKTFLQFFNDSSRNLFDKRDIRPYFDKLIHANGISFTGIWRIDEPSPYTGYFAQGSHGLLIARASVAGPDTTVGHSRAFGIAGKVFPTMDPSLKCKPGNFVTVSGLSGTRVHHVSSIEVTNMPTVGLNPAANVINRIIFRLMDSRPGYRQLFPISTLGLQPNDPVVTPDLMMLKVEEGTPQINAADFRDELRVHNYPNQKLIYSINVRKFTEADWTRLGVLEFTEDAVSEGGDKRIHFWIPRDIPDRT